MKLAYGPALLAITLCAFSAGCGDPDAFDQGVAKGAAEAEPFQLDSEQVSINLAQLACGVNDELWSAPGGGSDRSISRLLQKGRDLSFSDDVSSEELGYTSPYTQVRGKFTLVVDHVASIRDGEDKLTKIVQAKIGIKVAEPCFDTPLFIMGTRKGEYHEDLPATLQYERYGEGWHLTKILH
ncbi:MAG: hypothetical protein ABI833_04960 [Acidobacteriota bacterium]